MSQVERDSSLWLYNRWNIRIDVELYFNITHLANTLEEVFILFCENMGIGRCGGCQAFGLNFVESVVDLSPVYTTVILGTARLNFGTRTNFFGHGTPNFCRVNAKLRVLVTHAFCFSHCQNIVSIYKQNIEGNVVRRSHILYKSSDIYYMVMHKDAIQLVILLNSSQSPQQSEEKRNSIFKQFHLAMLIYVMVKIIVISY